MDAVLDLGSLRLLAGAVGLLVLGVYIGILVFYARRKAQGRPIEFGSQLDRRILHFEGWTIPPYMACVFFALSGELTSSLIWGPALIALFLALLGFYGPSPLAPTRGPFAAALRRQKARFHAASGGDSGPSH